jgi:plastocyanin
MSRVLAVTLLAISVAGLAACGGDDDEPVVLVDGVSSEVGVIDNTFRPEQIEVAAGTEVVWQNAGRNAHNVLPVDGDDWGVTAEAFAPGDTYSHRFTEPGTYDYYCSLHGTTTKGMVGTIVVTG